MSRKTLNAQNLAALGPDRLAALLIEVSTGSAQIKRRLRLELSHTLGPAELARDVRKRLASIRRTTGYVSWRKRKALVKDLETQARMITEKIAPDAATDAFDLLWQFLELGDGVFARTDDSRGEVAAVFHAARTQLAPIAQRAAVPADVLAGRLWDALTGPHRDTFDGIIPLLAPALGPQGLDHLKSLIEAEPAAQDNAGAPHAALQFLRDLRGEDGAPDLVARQHARLVRTSLQDIATAQGDTDAFIAQYTQDDLRRPDIAAQVAQMLLAQDRAAQALEVLEGAQPDHLHHSAHTAARVDCLMALGRAQDAQALRLAWFHETLDPAPLRAHLKSLPDFDDVEAEDAAKAHAAQFADLHRALRFFLAWPDLHGAAGLVVARHSGLDGNAYTLLAPAAEALRARHPLAATLLWRAMIAFTLHDGRSSRYGHAADYLLECAAAEDEVTDWHGTAPHSAYLEALREAHRHKASFWARLP